MSTALYIRLSKEDDHDGPSESVTNQKALLTQYAEEKGLTVHDIYIDDGWSGCSFDRPAFRRLLMDIEAGAVNVVITKDLSRLGRDYILTGHYLERYFPEHRVRYISLLDGIDTGSDNSANDITPFRAIMNDMYAKDISRKITSVKRDQQRRGLFIGGKAAYGYRKHPLDKNRLIVDEDAAATVRRIFSMALAGISCREIASRLNQEHIPTPAQYAGLPTASNVPYAGLWSSERISEMLQNETYIGNMVQGKRVKSSYKSPKSLRRKREDWVVVENTHEPLVTRPEFDAVQRLIASRRRTRHRTYDHPLKGLIFCHECGCPLGVINRKTAKGTETLYFICRTYQRFTRLQACTAHCIKVQTVSDLVAKAVADCCAPCLHQLDLVSAAKKEVESRICRRENSQPELQGKADRLTAQLDRAYLDHLSGMISTEDFLRIQRRLRQERDALTARLEESTLPAPSPISPDAAAAQLAREFRENIGRDRAILLSLIDRVELTSSKEILITFKCTPPGTQ